MNMKEPPNNLKTKNRNIFVKPNSKWVQKDEKQINDKEHFPKNNQNQTTKKLEGYHWLCRSHFEAKK